ncbi:BTB domain-containing protein [Mycena kentingensis (nom. inval.)]|nr:BTB domain-containing protein [Mycena kentingensis (nom. inval.)]
MDLSDTELTRCDELWFSDCGLVIRAENTVYRISRDFMAIHSPIFRDMLALPSPPNVETFDGCPLVFLPDSEANFTPFLKALFYHEYVTSRSTSSPVLTSILRMSHKYEVASLRKRAAAHLSAVFPTTLADYDSLSTKKIDLAFDLTMYQVIDVARLTALDWILPAAFYEAVKLCDERDLLRCSMAEDDKLRWVVGCLTMTANETGEMIDFLWNPKVVPFCARRLCEEARIAARRLSEIDRKYSRAELCFMQGFMPLELWNKGDWEDKNIADAVCVPCLTALKRAHARARESFWRRLPSIFDLPDWDELEVMKAAVLSEH